MSEQPTVPLQDHLEAMIKASEARSDIKISAAKEAAALLATASEKALNIAGEYQVRAFASVNEFRGAMLDQQKNFATSDTVTALEKKVDAMGSSVETRLTDLRVAITAGTTGAEQRRAGGAPLVQVGMFIVGAIITALVVLVIGALTKGGTP